MSFSRSERSNLGHYDIFALISQKRWILWSIFIWNTYSKSYVVSQLTSWSLTLDDIQGKIEVIECLVGFFSWMVHAMTNIYMMVSHIWSFSWLHDLWPWMIFDLGLHSRSNPGNSVFSVMYSTNHIYLHRSNAFGVWQPRLHLCYETLKRVLNFSELA